MTERNMEGALTFVGFAISVLAILYFAFEYIPYISEWSQVASLLLLAVSFWAFARYVNATVVGEPFFSGPRLQWLRPANIFNLLAILSAVMADVAFFGVDGIDTPVKVLVSLAAGIAIVLVAARRRRGASVAAP